MINCLLGLGSNLGDTRDNLDQAVAALSADKAIDVVKVSSWLVTTAVGGPTDQQVFLNGALQLRTTLAAIDLLAVMQEVEKKMGRYRDTRWGPRLIDLDLLLYGEQQVDLPGCCVPHPWMAIRRFVLEPAAEVAPTMNHPVIGVTVSQLMDHLAHAVPVMSIISAKPSLAKHCASELKQQISGTDRSSSVGSTGSTKTKPIESTQEWAVMDSWSAEPSPKLLVLLSDPDFGSNENAQHEQLLARVRASATPWLELSNADPDRVLHDLRAAIVTMQ